jgi:hypothetical protein
MAAWYIGREDVEDVWPDAPDEPQSSEILEIARDQVLAYAPLAQRKTWGYLGLLPGEDTFPGEDTIPSGPWGIPERIRLAQLRQAKNLWRADNVDTSGNLGEGEFSYQPRPLDWHVKQLIRPRGGRPLVG